ncbi:RagB/SusD family nutrient uptake outer membrane protein [Fibrisoma montanum]|uniref:RagB/SusD family nutrient uptake outer membrane protein n=1 Tax=Fibrisoma montanum TaxID=2305895 RepID=A0A418MI02_9BACT|nr:RagB/SusD family nutrient uptake outer membrane protein [Fibrisoma montanum]RIV26961.1 RagB/SusD family nutrient uptake outer membrane protein [Fibrisoma montanum]
MNQHNSLIRSVTQSLLVMGALLLSTTGCKDLLEEVPVSQVGSQYASTPSGFEAVVKAAYSSLREYYGREDAMTLTVFGTDTYTMGADGSFKFVNQYTSQIDGRLALTNNIWNAFYKGINTINVALDAADGIGGLDATIKKRRVAELKFLRAHHYFILVQMFGPVSLLTKGNLVPTKEFTRAPVKDIYAQIITDLESSLTDLGTPTSEYGRVTKGAAEHLLAKVYLTKGTDKDAAAADDFNKAATYAQNVIKNYTYKLLPDFSSVFAQGGGEINDEVIFATQYTSDPITNIGSGFNSTTTSGVTINGNQTHLYFGMEYDVQAGMQRDVLNGRPFKRFMPTTYMLNTVFDPAKRSIDSRYKKTFKDTWLSNRPGTFTNLFDTSKKSVTFASGDTTIFIPGVEWTMEQRAAKKYQVLVPSLYRPNLFPVLQKFLDPLRPDRTYEAGSRDFIMFRLAETHLIAAEALIKQGKAAEAVPFINAVRRRAAWPGKEKDMEITAAQATMEFIYEERERELAGEMHRWFDLKRWGILVDRVKKYNPDGAPNVKEFHNLRPIPQDQIDRTAGGTQSYPQNPGY